MFPKDVSDLVLTSPFVHWRFAVDEHLRSNFDIGKGSCRYVGAQRGVDPAL